MESTKTMQPVENESDQEARIRELTEENELLFEQLHVVQEELEKYYYKLKECEERAGAATASGANSAVAVVSPKAAAAMAENQKLHALVEQLQAARRVETQNSMAARLGQVLIEGVASTGSLLALPGRLRRMWKELDRKTPPAALGGKTFQKVIDAYAGDRDDAVERQLDGAAISHVMRANAYTALARQLMGSDAKSAASYARRAWESDPRPFRLKWLASRVYEAGDTATAEALLDMLPEDIAMSDSEKRQAMRIRQQAKQARDKKAKTESGNAGQAAALQREVQSLRNERDDAQKKLAEQQKAAAKYKSDAETQKKEKDAVRREAATLRQQAEDVKAEAEGLRGELEQSQRQAAEARAHAETMRAARDAVQQIADERRAELERADARHETLQRLYTESFGQAAEQWKTLQAQLATQGEALSSGFEQVGKNIVDARSKLEKFSKNELDNVLQQSVAYEGLASFFDTGKLPAIKAWKRGWPASPDFVLYQVELIARNEYDLIIEFGSGYTTLHTAKTLALLEAQGKKVARAVSFDHLEQYHQQTISLLKQEGLEDRVQVIHAPLEEYSAPDGVTYQYYSCRQTLAELAAEFGKDAPRVLVIVDGPPSATGKNARYPAFPITMKYFSATSIDFILDDYNRNDEKELANIWGVSCGMAGISCKTYNIELECGTFLLRVDK